jgi:hypothetical protein
MKEIKIILKSPLYFHGNCSKACPTDSDFLAYLVPLDVDVTGNITAKLCEVWSEFNIFCTLVTMATAAILNFVQPLFCFHDNCGKACPTIPIFWAYLVPLDVDVVPIKCHQFLLGE